MEKNSFRSGFVAPCITAPPAACQPRCSMFAFVLRLTSSGRRKKRRAAATTASIAGSGTPWPRM
jgi:hypothetical protein